MEASSDLANAPKEFLRLFKAGQQAARRGDKAAAHDLFRQAIEVDPYHEQVWLWLASVVETDADQRVCFENVLELNPGNMMAQQQLQLLESRALSEAMNPHTTRRKRPRRKRLLLALLFLIILGGGAAGAVVVLGLV
jgi:ferric-dicitrate binding protein FerR (iron transport regulator)